jgi:hypothetical protein
VYNIILHFLSGTLITNNMSAVNELSYLAQ